MRALKVWFLQHPLPFAMLLVLALTLATILPVQAYTVYHKRFEDREANFNFDANYPGGNWRTLAREGAEDWTETGEFTFSEGGQNGQATIRYSNFQSNPLLPNNALGVTFPIYGDQYRTGYVIYVNSNPPLSWHTANTSDVGNGVIPDGTYDARTLLRHELGHAIGVGHTTGDNNLMFWVLEDGLSKSITAEDDRGIDYLHSRQYNGVRPEADEPAGEEAAIYYFPPGYLGGNAEEESAHVGFSGGDWSNAGVWSKASNQELAYTDDDGSKVWVAFSGERITRYFTMAPNRGRVEVRIDGNYVETVDEESSYIHWQAKRTWTVANGQHVIEFMLRDEDENTHGVRFIDADRFYVNDSFVSAGTYQDSSGSLSYIGNWTNFSGAGPSGGSVRYSNQTQASVSLTFQGNRVDYCYTRASNRGKASVAIDGEQGSTLDLYSPNTSWNNCTVFSGLGGGIHTIHVAVTGDKHNSSQGTYIDIDRFRVYQ